MRMMAMSLLRVNSEKACSTALTGVSMKGGQAISRVFTTLAEIKINRNKSRTSVNH